MKTFPSLAPLLSFLAVFALASSAAASVPTVSIKASSSSISAGQSDTLTVTETSAASIHVTGSNGSSYTLPYSGGSITVMPSSTTTYTATATNSSGSATSQVTVTVGSSGTTNPTVTIRASSSSITAGSSDTLTVTASNATSVNVAGSDGSMYSVPASGGSFAVSPKSTTTYTATAKGSSGATASAQTTITVGATSGSGPTVTIKASSSNITAGQTDTLTVTASSAASVHVTGSNGTSYTLPYSGGSIMVAPSSTTTYTATATNSHGSNTAQVTVTVGAGTTNPTVTISAANSSISAGSSDTLTVTASNATKVTVAGSDGSSYTLSSSGGTVTVTPSQTTTYTAEASNASGTTASAETTVTVGSSTGESAIQHVIFMLQENHSFDDYFGMLNPYRHANGWDVGSDGKTYDVDGIDDKLNTIYNEDDAGDKYYLYKFRTSCIDDDSSAWLSSYGDVNRYNFATTRPIKMDGFVHTSEGYAKYCVSSPASCSGNFTDTTGERAMGYYDQGYLNYYYYMASQFAVSDRWFSPVSSNSIPNRIATFTGGTTQGLVYPPGQDKLPQLSVNNIFQELDNAGVSWKIYYTVTDGYCIAGQSCSGNPYPDTTFENLSYSYRYVYENPSHAACQAPTVASSAVGDSTNSFCVDPKHLAPLSQYYTDVKNNTLPAFAFIESGSGLNDEHPGSGQSILVGQAEVARIVNSLMISPSWGSSVFFFSYDEGGGPYDHVPPVPGHSNDFTDSSLGSIPDISSIAVNPDSYNPCVPSGGTPTLHCDLKTSENDPGTKSTDAPAQQGFKAQLGFRVPDFVVSPFVRKHYVSHIPMDHTAIIKFVENRFIGPSAHLTARDAAQPNLLDFFDFTNKPWATPPAPPTPAAVGSTCQPGALGP